MDSCLSALLFCRSEIFSFLNWLLVPPRDLKSRLLLWGVYLSTVTSLKDTVRASPGWKFCEECWVMLQSRVLWGVQWETLLKNDAFTQSIRVRRRGSRSMVRWEQGKHWRKVKDSLSSTEMIDRLLWPLWSSFSSLPRILNGTLEI